LEVDGRNGNMLTDCGTNHPRWLMAKKKKRKKTFLYVGGFGIT